MKRSSGISRLALAGTLLAGAATTSAQVEVESVPLADFGGALNRQLSSPVALSATQYLVAAMGEDGTPETADDLTLLITLRGPGDVLVTPLATPFLNDGGSNFSVALSTIRAVTPSPGPDGDWIGYICHK